MAEYLRFVIKEQRLEIKGGPIIYSDTISYIGATFLFDPEWNGLDRVLHFQKDGEATVYDIAIVGDKIDPSTSGMNLSGGIWQFWIHGTEIVEGESVRRLTTNKTSLEVKLSGVMHGEPLPTIRETISEQILSKAAHAERNAITSASISVNSTIGTPSATVSFSQQTDTGKQVDFAFSGVKGEKGDTGEKGAKGDTGAKGDKGDTGAKGDKGDTGAKGDKGDTGATGPKGDKGDTGVKGDKGDTGAAGPKGDTGERGAKGDKGDTGASAGFGTPTAVIDANVGTPYVTVTASGPDTAKVFAFDFKNLKGETGATGTTDFDQLVNRPKYNDADMTHSTNVPEVKTAAWDAKYDKPSVGIPSTDMTSAVQTSLGKADTAQQPFKVTITWDSTAGTFSSNKTTAEIHNAFNAGKYVYAYFNNQEFPCVYSGTTSARFALTQFNGVVTQRQFYINYDAQTASQTVTYTETVLQPQITSANQLPASLVSGLAAVATSGSYNDLSNKPTIPVVPTNVSAFTNDAGYLTQHQSLAAYRTSADQDVIDASASTQITNINAKIPTEATSSNQLADKSYVGTQISAHHDSTKQDTISDLATIRSNASSGASKISCTDATVGSYGYTKNTGTITGINMNGASKGTSGVVDLGTVITSHQDISGKENASNKVTSISSASTDTEYPSAKCVYDLVGNIESALAALR